MAGVEGRASGEGGRMIRRDQHNTLRSATPHSPAPLSYKLAWPGKGTDSRLADKVRSVCLSRFASLARLEGVQLFSLQAGPGSEQLTEMAGSLWIVDLGSRFETWMDTAAAMMNLDLIIAVDTGIVHCAGALGRPVWVLLPFAPDWRGCWIAMTPHGTRRCDYSGRSIGATGTKCSSASLGVLLRSAMNGGLACRQRSSRHPEKPRQIIANPRRIRTRLPGTATWPELSRARIESTRRLPATGKPWNFSPILPTLTRIWVLCFPAKDSSPRPWLATTKLCSSSLTWLRHTATGGFSG